MHWRTRHGVQESGHTERLSFILGWTECWFTPGHLTYTGAEPHYAALTFYHLICN